MHYCACKGTTKLQLLQRVFQRMLTINSSAQFKINISQFECLKGGIAKIMLTMTPMNHERIFKKDKIGKKLYELYLKVKRQDDNF